MPAPHSALRAPRSSFDGIILGTGHNALVLQAYLCRSGQRVLSVDRADVPGGGLTTIENPRLPGFRHNTHSFFHRAVTTMPWYRDLELERHGAGYIEPELNVAMILPDGRTLQWWTDLDRTVDSFAQFSQKDAAALRRWAEEFRPIVDQILVPEAQSPPLPPARRRELLSRSDLGRRLLEVSALSPLEFVQREFEHDAVRAGLLFFNGLREVDLRLKGFGHSIPALLAGRHKAQMCIGGVARLAQALVHDIHEHGGDIRTGVKIKRIVTKTVSGGRGSRRAAGVELADGELLTADAFIASGLNPQQTFLELLDADAVPQEIRDRAAAFQYNLLAPLFALNLALDEPPHYTAAQERPEIDDALMVILGLERFGQFDEIVTAHERGDIPPTVMWGACPTRFDPTQAPPNTPRSYGRSSPTPYAVRRPTGTPRKTPTARACSRSGPATLPTSPRPASCSTASPARRWTPSAPCPTCATATCWSAPSPTTRSATTAPSPAPAPTAPPSPASTSAAAAPTPEATSPASAATTRPP
jgi:phytoene dehydrogenase-like protein